MAKLPYSRVVNVNLSRNDAFPSRRGFGVALLLTTTALVGVLDETKRTKVYGSIEEVSADFGPTTEPYKALLTAFGQNPRPTQVKVGYVAVTPATSTGADLQAELDKLYDRDNGWYWLTVEKGMRDKAMLDGLVDWVQAKNKLAVLDTNDVKHEDPADETNLSARHKGTVDRTATFYHNDPDEYPALALAASLGTRNFDDANSLYTAKFKRLKGVSPLDLGSAAVQAITGFVPQLGQSEAAGHMANTYVDIGGQDLVVEGSVLSPNVFIDEIHATDWIIARTEEETLGVLLNNDAIPFTDQGMEILASGVRTVMRLASRAGLIASDIDPSTGLYAPSVEITIPSVFEVPESQRKARIAPAIQVRFRYAGAVHYTTINYRMTF